jgi:hypothetical protein
MDPETLLRGISLSEEFACDLGDPRRTRRVQLVAKHLARKPELSLPELFDDPSELEAAYRLFRNPNVSLLKLMSAHFTATAQRCQGLDAVLAVHDTTEFDFGVREDHVREHLCRLSTSRQGFYGHLSLAVSVDGFRAPLGVLNCFAYVHQDQVEEDTRTFWDELFGKYERESERWAKAIVASEQRIAGGTRVIHVCDREADMNSVLQTLHEAGSSYVIRAYQERRTVDGVPVYQVPGQSARSVRRVIELSERPSHGGLPKSRKTFRARKARRVEVVIRGHHASFAVGRKLEVNINVVEVLEENPPEGEERVHWVLLTSERLATEADLLRIVDIYRSRWLIEEFFKAIKTGCGYEDRQLESASTLLAALGITLVLAWQLLVLRHLSRLDEQQPVAVPRLPGSLALTPQQLAVLMAMTPKLKWPPEPTLCDVVRGIARLGGHHRSNGPPGWQVLGRGFRKLMDAYQAARLMAAAGLVIDA